MRPWSRGGKVTRERKDGDASDHLESISLNTEGDISPASEHAGRQGQTQAQGQKGGVSKGRVSKMKEHLHSGDENSESEMNSTNDRKKVDTTETLVVVDENLNLQTSEEDQKSLKSRKKKTKKQRSRNVNWNAEGEEVEEGYSWGTLLGVGGCVILLVIIVFVPIIIFISQVSEFQIKVEKLLNEAADILENNVNTTEAATEAATDAATDAPLA